MNKWLNRFAIFLCSATLGLIFIGGLVKTTDSGLAVPDWPLSYGKIMPPMVGGIFYEHGHRMVAASVGFLTILLALSLTFKDDRRWMKKAGWAAVGLVIFQGVLGGLTVLLRLPPQISIAHACTAQAFFCLTVCLAVWTNSFWRSDAPLRAEPPNTLPLHRLALALAALCYVQLILGATLRHTGRALPFHISGAALVAGFVIWFARRVRREKAGAHGLSAVASGLVIVLLVQLALGAASYFILNHRFDVIPIPFSAIATVTAHVAVGALLLGLSVLAVLISYKTRPAHVSPLKTTFQDYFTLTKPGISFMAGITALAGFVLGSRGDVNFFRLIHTCVGTLLAAAGAGCLNMLLEKDVDAQMNRTQTRPLPSGRLQHGEVLLLGLLCSILGVVYLCWAVNFLTGLVAAITLSVYLYVYTPLKKVSWLCVTVGAVAGALPPVIGWTAATGRLSIEALVLFGILFFWQYPHFLSLAWLYKADYDSAGLRMLPQTGGGDGATAWQILLNSVALLIVSVLPSFFGMTGAAYFGVALAVGTGMVFLGLDFFRDPARASAKKVFLFSLLYIPLLVVFMLLNNAALWAL